MLLKRFMNQLLLLSISTCIPVQSTFSWDSCSSDDPNVLLNLAVSTDPIVIPGNVTFSFSLQITQAIVSPTPGAVTAEFRATSDDAWTTLPCLDNIGSCHYDDACTFLSGLFSQGQSCPESFEDNDVPCRCPFNVGTYNITNGVIPFANQSLLPAWLPSGDYHLYISSPRSFCYEFYFGIQNADGL